MQRSFASGRARRRIIAVTVSRFRRLRAEKLENRMLMAVDLASGLIGNDWLESQSSPAEWGPVVTDAEGDGAVGDNYTPDNRPPSDDNDDSNWTQRLDGDALTNLLALSTPAVIGRFTSQALSFTTLANGMPVLNSLVGSPTSVFLDFDGDTTTSTDPYDVDGSPTTFNATEQNTIAESWRQIATYFAMFDTNVTTTLPASGHPKVWAAVGNNIVGGYCFVNTFPNNTQPRCFNNSGDARTRNSGIAHEVGHNFGLSHQSDFDLLGGETADYSSGYDQLHVPIMGVDFAQRVRKFVIGHTSNASVLQDDVNIIRNDIIPYQAAGGDGFRADDFGGTIATATPLTAQNDVQYASGIIERLTDVDAFSFTSNGQTMTVSALADFPSGVDLKLEIYDALGVLVAAKDAPTLNDQEITLVLPSGTYHALVSSHGNYGDLGTYNLAVRSLPSGWTQGDIGVVGVTGFSQFHTLTNSFVLGASGADIGGTTDEMQFARQTLTGDGTIIAKVTSLVNTTGNAKAGIVIRESLAGNSKHVSVTPTPTGGVKFIRRTTTGGSATTTSSTATAFAPVWVRLQRVGNVFTASTSTNGTTWTTLGTPQTVAMNATVQIGLVATAQNDRLFTAAEFESVSITGALGNTTPTPNSLPAPTGVAVTRGTGSDLEIAWTDQASETGYRVERSIDGVVFTTAGSTAADVTTFVDTGLVGTMRYFYRVVALDAAGASIPSTIVSELNRPSAVGNLELTSYSTTQIVLDWIETSGETGYRIERSPDGVTYTTIATVGAQIPSYTASGLTVGTAYFFRVTPTSAFGDGPSSVISGGTRLAAVTNLAFSSILGNAVSLSWTDLTTETGYQIQRSTNGTTFTNLTTLPANAVAFTDNTVTAGNEYYYRVLGTLGQSVSLFNLAFTATPTITALPSPWISQDIGTVSGGGVGSTTYSGTTFKVVSSGTNIGGTTDSFRYTHQTLTGNGVITARVASLEDSNGTSTRFGVMFRETLNSNSRYAMMALREGNTGTAQFSSRAGVGTSASVVSDLVRNAPYWVRVTRAGNLFTGFTSSDGTTWTQIGQATIAMPSTIFVGLAASSGISTLLNTATATNVSALANPTISITSTDQVYNNSTYVATASITGNSPLPTLSYVYYSDAAGTTVIPAPVNVGTYYVRATSSANAANNAAQSAISSFDITPFDLTIAATGLAKIYDGSTSASVTFTDDRFAGDVLTVSATSTFNNKNVGTSKPISVTGISLSGADAINYTHNTTASTTGNVNAKVLVASATAQNKTYNGDTSAIVTILLSGIVGTESVTGTATGDFDTKNAGIGKAVSIGVVTLSGTASANYTVGAALPTTADVTPLAINAQVTAGDKVYDANVDASVNVSLVGILGSDVVTATALGVFNDKNAAANKTVTIGPATISGSDAANYNITFPSTTTASITPLAINAQVTASDEVYDANVDASVNVSLVGILGSDVVTATALGVFDDKNAGANKTVTIGPATISGSDAANYNITIPSSTTASITPLAINAQVTGDDKVYDANVDASVNVSLIGILGSDVVTATALGVFNDKNAAANKPVTIGSVTISGSDAVNYNITVPSSTTASIAAKAITGSITAANKTFDGTISATILTRSLNGVLVGDDVSYTGGTATFDTAAIGTSKVVTAADLGLSGTDAANYSVNSTATATADITQPVATIASRHVFYNNASGANLSSDGAAENAIASDKIALLPGEASTYANYTNYSRGLNGILIDINNLPATTSESQILASLQFAHWNGIDGTGFADMPTAAIPTATILSGSGTGGSTRVKIVFPDNTLQNTWLRVSVAANPETALASADVFYFGNVIGEVNTGNTPTRLRVNATDTGAVRSNQSTAANSASVTNWFDINRDGRVNATDTGIVRSNQQTAGIVAPITAPPLVSSSVSLQVAVLAPIEISVGPKTLSEEQVLDVSTILAVPVKKLQAGAVAIRSDMVSPIVTNPVSAAEKPAPRGAAATESVDLYFASL